VGTSLFVIFLNCAAGLIGHASGSHFNWDLTVMVMILAVGGAGLGTVFSQRLAANRLQKMFAVLVLAVSVVLFAKNYTVLYQIWQ
ncbi:MAG TPA: sulfite exporter TauE/SafE family protein, partial [Pyrinomonadaceae bacterium]|nr:sulfite exporter TauE/SafE family protein [Pyrinomonadaceae bacterium]